MKTEWISTKESKPDVFKRVIISGGVGFYIGNGFWKTIMDGEPYQIIDWHVTHWMPLMQAPKQ